MRIIIVMIFQGARPAAAGDRRAKAIGGNRENPFRRVRYARASEVSLNSSASLRAWSEVAAIAAGKRTDEARSSLFKRTERGRA